MEKVSLSYLFVVSLFISVPVNYIFAQDQTAKLKNKIDTVNAIKNEYISSNIISSIELFTQNWQDAQSIGYKPGVANSLKNLGLANYLGGFYDKAATSYIQAINIFEELKDYKSLAYTYGEFGYQLKRRNMKSALKYMRLAILIAEDHRYDSILNGLYDNYGVLMEMENDPDSAMYYYKKALNMKYRTADSLGIPYSLNNIAGIYASKGMLVEAIKYLDMSDRIRNKQNDKFGRIENLTIRGDLYSLEGKIEPSIHFYKESLKLAEEISYKYLISYDNEKLANLYEKKSDYKRALFYRKNYEAYKDSISNEETNKKIEELGIKFETERKDRKIVESALSLKEKTLQISVLGGSLILMIVVSFWIYKYQKLKRERIKNELELNNRLYKAEMESKISEEKLRISDDLHDHIGSHLSNIITGLEISDKLIADEGKSKLKYQIQNLENYTRALISELRQTILALKQDESDFNSLVEQVKKLIEERLKISIVPAILFKYDIQKNISLSPMIIQNIFRICQEALNNSIKYSNSEKISVELNVDVNDLITLTISDSGKGFNISETIDKGNGLESMRRRAERMNGELIIDSCRGEGASIEFRLAVNQKT